jgi:ABC-type dipeptide/oligopeptide/nickel transport system permease subunit
MVVGVPIGTLSGYAGGITDIALMRVTDGLLAVPALILAIALAAFWNPSGVETDGWASATVQRVAKRIHWTPPDDLVKLVAQAAAEPDAQKRSALYAQYEKAMIDQANLIVLFQPIYQIAVRDAIKRFPLTAAGWEVELYDTSA